MSSPSQIPIAHDWFAGAFDATYAIVYAHRSIQAAEPETRFAAEVLGLKAEETVLDLCCGNGRHLVHLQAVTPCAFGLDYSDALLRLAAADTVKPESLVQGDMRKLPFPEVFDAVCNFFTSFGYFQSDEENLGVLSEIARVLKPGGRFLVDYLNPPCVRSTLVPRSERNEERYTVNEERWIEEKTQRVNKVTRLSHDGVLIGRQEESVRLYSLVEMTGMMNTAGLEIISVYGDYDGVPYDENQPRMILVGRRQDR